MAGSILAVEALHTSYQRAALGEVPMASPFMTPLNPNPVFTLAAAFIVSCPPSNPPLPFKAFPTLTATGGSCVAEEPAMKKRTRNEGMFFHLETPLEALPPLTQPHTEWSSGHIPAHSSTASSYYPTKATTTTQSFPTSSPTDTSGTGCALPTKTACAAAAGSQYTFTAASNIPAGSFVTFASGLSVASVEGTIKDNTVVASIPAIAQGQTYVFITNKSENATVADADVLFGPAIIEVAPPAPIFP